MSGQEVGTAPFVNAAQPGPPVSVEQRVATGGGGRKSKSDCSPELTKSHPFPKFKSICFSLVGTFKPICAGQLENGQIMVKSPGGSLKNLKDLKGHRRDAPLCARPPHPPGRRLTDPGRVLFGERMVKR